MFVDQRLLRFSSFTALPKQASKELDSLGVWLQVNVLVDELHVPKLYVSLNELDDFFLTEACVGLFLFLQL